MYSIVMLAAMTATPATPDFHGLFGGWCHKSSHSCTGYTSCNGCTGYSCTGYTYSSCNGCTGYSCTGCTGYTYSSCNGCTGYTSCNGCTGHTSCNGCTGYSSYSHSSHGSGLFHGHKAYHYSSCTGCTGCSGGHACHGVPTYYYQTYSSCTGCTGCTGYSPTTWVAPYSLGGAVAPAGTGYYPAPTAPATTPAPTSESIPPAVSLPGSRAQVVVKVPANAKLYADGQLTGLTGEERTFMTPELNSNRDYQYTLKIEHEVDGEMQVVSKEVVVRGGQRTIVDLSATEVARASSPVSVNLPENARLFVDENLAVSGSGRKTFRTPELAQGATYTYVFRVEVEVAGKVETQSQKVNFKAGEPIRIDFADITSTRTASAR